MSSSIASENNTEDDYYSHNLIPLKIHDKLKEKDIVQRYAIDSRTANIVIELNHAYEDTNVNINIKDYPNIKKLRDGLENFLIKKKGVNKDDASMLADVIDNNRQMIEDAYYRYDKKKDNGNKGEGAEDSNVNSDLDSDDGGDDDVDDIGGSGDGKPPSESETILSRLQDGNLIHELFVDQYNTPYAAIKVKDHIETISMRTKASTQFKNWICYNMYSGMGLVPKDESLNNVLNVLRARATYEGKIRKLYLRVGPSPNLDSDSDSNSDLGDVDDDGDGNGSMAITTTTTTSNTTTAINAAIEDEGKHNEILYDLTNKNWEFVRINADGWSIEKYVDTTPIFKRYRNQSAQMYPSKKYPSDIFERFMKLLNIKDTNAKLLLKVYLILLVFHKLQKPILAPYGEQGSAKSTLHEYIKQIIDPSAAITLAFPRDVNELIQKLDHNYIAYFDNISRIPDWISDQFCRAVTGSGFSKRQLYTDDDDIIFSFRRPLGFNGINLAATKADLLDRCLIIMLERISEDKRRPLEDIVTIKGMNKELDAIKPQLLGFIFDTVSKVIKAINTTGIVKPKELPRMADFAIHGEVVARCLGYSPNTFLNAFNENVKLQSDELIESSPLAMAVYHYVQTNPPFEDTATKLLAHLNFVASIIGIEIDKFWPKGPGALSRQLNLIRTALRRAGVAIEFYKHGGEFGKSRRIKVCKISSEASESSVTSDIDPNQARTKDKPSDDTSVDTDDTDDTSKISSETQSPNSSTISLATVDTVDTDDIFHKTISADRENQEKSMTASKVMAGSNNDSTSGSNGSRSSGIGKVVHCMREPNYDVYIGREYHKNGIDLPESKWANHFIIGKDGTREQVIEKYRYYIMNQRPDLMAALSELEGKTLGCWCAPEPCHGDVLIELVNARRSRMAIEEEEEM